MKILIFLFCSILLTTIIATAQVLSPQDVSLQSTITSRQTIKGDGYGGEGYTVLPVLRNEKPGCTAILIHGLGGTGEEWGFISLALSFFSLNYVKFIIPSAELRDVTYLNEKLPSWFNIFRRSGLTTRLNRGELLDSVGRMNNIIQGEIAAGVPSERIFVIGFSQGGAVALTTFLRSSQTLAGVIGVATWLPLDNEYPAFLSDRIRKRDTLLIHGTNDTAVDIDYARKSRDILKRIGQPVELTEIEGGDHLLFDKAVITSIEDFILTRANGTSRYIDSLLKDLTSNFKKLNSRLSSVRI